MRNPSIAKIISQAANPSVTSYEADAGGAHPAGGVEISAPGGGVPDAPRAAYQHFTFGDAPAAAIPAEAEAILERLRDARADLRTISLRMADELQKLHQDRIKAVQRLAALCDSNVAARYGTTLVEEDHPSAIQAKANLDVIETKVERLNARMEGTLAQHTLGAVVDRIERFLKANVGVQLTPAPAPKAKAGETVERLRERMENLRVDLNGVRIAPLPSAECKARARAEIAALAERGRPNVMALLDHGEEIRWPRQNIAAQLFGHVASAERPGLVGSAREQIPDTLALLAYLYKDPLLAAIDSEIDAVADDGVALSHEDRARRERELMGDILNVERIECGLVAASGTMDYRADADPRAVLCIAGPPPDHE